MKPLIIFFTFLLTSLSLLATNSSLGTIETIEGDKILMYKHPSSRKLNFSKLPVGCDCANQKFKFFFINAEGKLEKIAEKLIKKVTIKEGAVYCKTFERESMLGRGSMLGSGMSSSFSFENALEYDTEMMSLPTSFKRKKLVLQTILARNEKYTLSIFTNDSGAAFANICSVKDGKLVDTSNYLSVGANKKGIRFLENLKEYFKDCDELLEVIKRNEQTNLKAKKRKDKVLYLQGVGQFFCE